MTFIDTVSNPTSQLTFKKLSLVKFWCSIKEEYPQFSEKAIKVSLLSPTTCLSLGFLHILPSRHGITTDCVQKQI